MRTPTFYRTNILCGANVFFSEGFVCGANVMKLSDGYGSIVKIKIIKNFNLTLPFIKKKKINIADSFCLLILEEFYNFFTKRYSSVSNYLPCSVLK